MHTAVLRSIIIRPAGLQCTQIHSHSHGFIPDQIALCIVNTTDFAAQYEYCENVTQYAQTNADFLCSLPDGQHAGHKTHMQPVMTCAHVLSDE